MGKKCIICGNPAKYNIKNSSEYYCESCALEHFSSLDLLESVDKRAKSLKKYIDVTVKLKVNVGKGGDNQPTSKNNEKKPASAKEK